MVYKLSSRKRKASRTEVKEFSYQKKLINSLLYNQVPLTVFFNGRAILATFALLCGYILATFVIPFFSLLSGKSAFEVSFQVSASLMFFTVGTLVSS